MAITGYLAEFSLAEVFQFLEQGHKTGLLTIVASPESRPSSHQGHYIWFKEGLIVAAASQSDGHGLSTLISQRGWLGDRAAFRLSQYCSPGTPLGLCLKSQHVLSSDQLKLLFYTQVMRQVCALFTLENGSFHFDCRAAIPNSELTGLSAPATEVTLAGLRALRDWSALTDKLPEATSSLVSVIEGKPHLRLKQTEWQVWEFTDGRTPLYEIAERLNITLEKLRQIAFRLIVVGLVEELPLLGKEPFEEESDLNLGSPTEFQAQEPSSQEAELSSSFLQNLVSFLTGKS